MNAEVIQISIQSLVMQSFAVFKPTLKRGITSAECMTFFNLMADDSYAMPRLIN